MLRVLGFLTLVLVAVCLILGASIALADEDAPAAAPADDRTIEAVDPDRRMIDDSLAARQGAGEPGPAAIDNSAPEKRMAPADRFRTSPAPASAA